MRPRNNTERRVVALSATLPAIRQKDIDRIKRDFKRTYGGKGFCYYLILERCKEFQVIRYYYLSRRRLFEFMQVWFNSDNKIILAKNRCLGVDNWIESSEMTIKRWFDSAYSYSYLGGFDRIPWSGSVVRSVLPELRKRGIKTSTHNISPFYLCTALMKSNRLETLFKLNQYDIVKYFAHTPANLTDNIWQAIRVALRHGYTFKGREFISDWVDYINDLQILGKDIRNPHYICPNNLHEEHQRYMEKARQLRSILGHKAQALAYEPRFFETRKMFLDLLLKDNELSISVIPTAMDIVKEGAAMHHCVGGYFDRQDSLILSATINGKRIETIEVDLNTYEIVQSRGFANKDTEYHKRILNLLRKHIKDIKQRNKAA